MTQAELIAGLAPSRLPETMQTPGWPELLVLFGLGLLLGAALALLLRPVMRHQLSKRQRIRATRGMAPQERLLAIARILGHLPAALRPAAYGAEPPPDPRQIERLSRWGR